MGRCFYDPPIMVDYRASPWCDYFLFYESIGAGVHIL